MFIVLIFIASEVIDPKSANRTFGHKIILNCRPRLWLTEPVRITGGHAARRILKAPKGLDVRPTPDLVKQAVFNSLGARVLGTRVLELFAGTGALSLECLSRGAVSAVCVEKSSRHAEVLRHNFIQTGFPAGALQVRVQDVFVALGQLAAEGVTFELVLADPPYGEKNIGRRSNSFAQQVLDDPILPSLLAPGGLLILGHTKRDTLDVPEPWRERKLLKHGDTVMRFLEFRSA
jgi:16S rRNA (guanine966-N2)-methyltransferase